MPHEMLLFKPLPKICVFMLTKSICKFEEKFFNLLSFPSFPKETILLKYYSFYTFTKGKISVFHYDFFKEERNLHLI